MHHMQVQFGPTPTVRLETCSQLTVQHSGVDEHFFQFPLEVLNVKAAIFLRHNLHALL